ncbi:hypothetical protein [Bacillus manliponensis]|nr:hypothetical protein [Bacillus manliponensis]
MEDRGHLYERIVLYTAFWKNYLISDAYYLKKINLVSKPHETN